MRCTVHRKDGGRGRLDSDAQAGSIFPLDVSVVAFGL